MYCAGRYTSRKTTLFNQQQQQQVYKRIHKKRRRCRVSKKTIKDLQEAPSSYVKSVNPVSKKTTKDLEEAPVNFVSNKTIKYSEEAPSRKYVPPVKIRVGFHKTTHGRHPPPVKTITWRWDTGGGDARNWVELPPEITLRIFMNLETVDIILTVSQVCSSWRHLSKDPALYRSVVIGEYDSVFFGLGFRKIVREAVNRSCGKLVQFSCGNMRGIFIEDICYMVDSSNSLKSLRVGYLFDMYDTEFFEVIKNIPSLEELYIHHISPICFIQDLGFLKYLEVGVVTDDADVTASEIAECLPYLRSLRLLANGLTDNGLQAIIDGCPHLEYVYVKGFSRLDTELLKKKYSRCDRIKSITVLLGECVLYGECVIFGEWEFHLKATSGSDGRLSDSVGDYDGLLLNKSSFKNNIPPHFRFQTPLRSQMKVQASQ